MGPEGVAVGVCYNVHDAYLPGLVLGSLNHFAAENGDYVIFFNTCF